MEGFTYGPLPMMDGRYGLPDLRVDVNLGGSDFTHNGA